MAPPAKPSRINALPAAGTDRPRLLLLAPHSSYRITPYLNAAQALQLDLLIASTSEHSLVSAVAEGLRIDFSRPADALSLIQREHQRRPFCGVVASDDASVGLAASVAQSLGLPHNPPDAVRRTQRKDLARACLTASGIPAPRHARIDLQTEFEPQLAALDYPLVLKPLSLSGSRGVIRANTPEAALSAAQRIARIIRNLSGAEGRYLLAEDYLPGEEVALEGMLQEGRLQVLALFDKPDALDGPFFEETYYIMPSRHPAALQEKIRLRVQQACAAYGLTQGPIHAELRLHNGEAWLLEIAARTIGGQCARLLQFGTGCSLEALVLAQAMNQPLITGLPDSAAGVLMIPIPAAGLLRRVEGTAAARKVAGIVDLEISVRDGYELVPLPEGSSYLGFIFARAETPAQVEHALRTAHDCLNIVTAPVWRSAPNR